MQEMELKCGLEGRKYRLFSSGMINPIDEYNKRESIEGVLNKYTSKISDSHYVDIANAEIIYRNDGVATIDGYEIDSFEIFKNAVHGGDEDSAFDELLSLELESGVTIREHNDSILSSDDILAGISEKEAIATSSLLGIRDSKKMAVNSKCPQWLIADILESNSIGFIGGKSQAFKSFIALDMCHCICSGRPFLGHEIMKKGSVLYILGEGENGIGRRLRAFNKIHGSVENFNVLANGQKIHEESYREMLKKWIRTNKPDLIVFDTFNQLAGHGISNNSSNEATSAMNFLKDISCQAELNNTVMIVHHYGKDSNKGLEGSHAFSSNSDFVFSVEREKSDSLITVMKCQKQKDSDPFEQISISLIPIDIDLVDQLGRNVTSLVIEKGNMPLAERARPKTSAEGKVTAKSETVRAIQHLHGEQCKTNGKKSNWVCINDIEKWMDKHSTKKFNRKWLKQLVEEGELKSNGAGIFKPKR